MGISHVCVVQNGSRVTSSWTHFLCCEDAAALAAAQHGTSVTSVDHLSSADVGLCSGFLTGLKNCEFSLEIKLSMFLLKR